MEGISAALLNQVVKECRSSNAIQFADREETDVKIASVEKQITDAVANI
jgi:inorganic pyrophosphatase